VELCGEANDYEGQGEAEMAIGQGFHSLISKNQDIDLLSTPYKDHAQEMNILSSAAISF